MKLSPLAFILWLLIFCTQFYLKSIFASSINSFDKQRNEINELIKLGQHQKNLNNDDKVAQILKNFLNKPYLKNAAMGEGDWQPFNYHYKPGAKHYFDSMPYRVDGFNCQTLVQTTLAMLFSNNLNEFDHHYVQIAYGAAQNKTPYLIGVDFFNRNHFIDGDFNKVNHRMGFLKDLHENNFDLSSKSILLTTNINRTAFFLKQINQISKKPNVADNIKLTKHFASDAIDEEISIKYLPKSLFDDRKKFAALFSQFDTPIVVEFINDPNIWRIKGQSIKELIGTNTMVSHIGILYQAIYKMNDVIYQRFNCELNGIHKTCSMTPVYCTQNICKELMFTHATNFYPKSYSQFNVVETIPFAEYLFAKQNGYHWHMDRPSFLGLHFEKIMVRPNKP